MDYVSIANSFVHIVGYTAAHLLENARHERGGTAEGHLRAQFGERPDIRAGNAAIENIAQNGNVQAFDFSSPFTDGKGVQQSLGRVFVGTVPGVDNTRVEHARQKVRRPRSAMTHDDEIGIQRLEVAGRVFERLAFLERGRFGSEIDDVSGE